MHPLSPGRSLALPITAAAIVLVALTLPAAAHEGAADTSGVLSGFLHPLLGPDHVLAMVAVGLLGAMLGAPAIYVLPIVFPMVMAFGGALGVAGVPLPGVETGIAVSAVVLGLMVAAGRSIPLAAAAVVVAVFAVFHGHAHGTELPAAADALSFAIGFVVGTGLLHVAGIVLGLPVRWSLGRSLVRALGGAIAIGGLAFLTGAA